MARIGELLATLLRRRTPDGDPLSDAVLLDRFARTRDQAAFELLVWRHGPLVLALCRRVLRNGHTAEDAFQATFLVLARKAGSVRGAVAGWLHRVALRVCLRMKRRLPSVPLDTDPVASPDADPVEAAERSAILDEEVSRLPEFLRVPVIVCYLQGHTTEHAAVVLGIPRGTVLSRLATARKRLAARLVRRGVGPAVAVLAALSVPELSADAGRTVADAAVGFTLGKSPDTVPAQLALEVLSMTNRTAVAMVGVLVLVAGLGTGVGLVAAQGQKPTPATAAGLKDKPPPTPIELKDANTVHRERVAKMIAQVDAELDKLKKAATGEADDPAALREQLRALETRESELLRQLKVERFTSTQPEILEMDTARQRLDTAKKAVVPADVLAEAVQSHPKVAEAAIKVNAKDEELRASKLPNDDAGRKKLGEERLALAKELQAVQKQVGPEVEAYLRAPGVVDAKKALATLEARVRQTHLQLMATHEEHDLVEREKKILREQLKVLQPLAEEMAWLKEKRRRLQQELLELELREAGVGK